MVFYSEPDGCLWGFWAEEGPEMISILTGSVRPRGSSRLRWGRAEAGRPVGGRWGSAGSGPDLGKRTWGPGPGESSAGGESGWIPDM